MIRQLALIGAPTLAIIASIGCSTVDAQRRPDPLFGVPKGIDQLAMFEPKPDGRVVRIEYQCTDAVLNAVVLDTGPSLRQWMPSPAPIPGTRIMGQDSSPFRLEGNKVRFVELLDGHRAAIASCLEGLVAIGGEVDIPRMPRDEQLAYWMNLHNMIVINELAKAYPVSKPRELEVGAQGLSLHSAPLVEVSGVRLSLNDIRQGIVFRYWRDPRVMYGFFTGELASPSIRTRAWVAASLSKDLDANAREFVNSLRGVREVRNGVLIVSPLYEDARDALFPNWPTDLRAHLRAFAGKDVEGALERTNRITLGRYEARTADLVGGYVPAIMAPMVAIAPNSSSHNIVNKGNGHVVFREYNHPAFAVALESVARKKAEIEFRQRKKEVVEIQDAPFEALPVKAPPKPIE
ncbi:MAG: DUF547 domain-containing protein [Myxococcales bacterium]|nr:DUF547 domain-containing protein [Myxococcales bacterium]MCB9649029.1 DUF547 domain-containing protein [Deltaproteobacteria bacterium]